LCLSAHSSGGNQIVMAAAPTVELQGVQPPPCPVPPPVELQLDLGNEQVVSPQSTRWSHTPWRMPQEDGKIPLYVQHDCLVKLFGLCSMQLAICLCIAGTVHYWAKDQYVEQLTHADDAYLPLAQVLPLPSHASTGLLVEYYMLGILNMVFISLLWTCRSRFPFNYASLALLTLSMGSFWGVSCAHFALAEHLFLLAQMSVTLGVASLVCFCLKWNEACFQHIGISAMAAMCVGWACGFILTVLYVASASPQNQPPHPWAVCALSFVSIIFILFFSIYSLVHSATDDVLGLVGGVDASVMAVISLPYLFVLLACCVPSAAQWTQTSPDSLGHREARPEGP